MQKLADFSASFAQVEMAGIEPASERIDPRASTSVVDPLSRRTPEDQQDERTTSHLDPKALCSRRS